MHFVPDMPCATHLHRDRDNQKAVRMLVAATDMPNSMPAHKLVNQAMRSPTSSVVNMRRYRCLLLLIMTIDTTPWHMHVSSAYGSSVTTTITRSHMQRVRMCWVPQLRRAGLVHATTTYTQAMTATSGLHAVSKFGMYAMRSSRSWRANTDVFRPTRNCAGWIQLTSRAVRCGRVRSLIDALSVLKSLHQQAVHITKVRLMNAEGAALSVSSAIYGRPVLSLHPWQQPCRTPMVQDQDLVAKKSICLQET